MSLSLVDTHFKKSLLENQRCGWFYVFPVTVQVVSLFSRSKIHRMHNPWGVNEGIPFHVYCLYFLTQVAGFKLKRTMWLFVTFVYSLLTGTPLSLAVFCDSHWFQKLETTRERTDKLWLRMNSDWFQSAANPKSWLNTNPLWLSSNKWCLVALVKSQQFVKKEKENQKDAMHLQKVQRCILLKTI